MNIDILLKILLSLNLIIIICLILFAKLRQYILDKFYNTTYLINKNKLIDNNKNVTLNDNKRVKNNEKIKLIQSNISINKESAIDSNEISSLQNMICNDINHYFNFFNNKSSYKTIINNKNNNIFTSFLYYIILYISKSHFIKYLSLFFMIIYLILIINIYYYFMNNHNQIEFYNFPLFLLEPFSYINILKISLQYSAIFKNLILSITDNVSINNEISNIIKLNIFPAYKNLFYNSKHTINTTDYSILFTMKHSIQLNNNVNLFNQCPVYLKVFKGNATNVALLFPLSETYAISFFKYKITGLSLPLLWLTTLILLLCTFYLLSLVFTDKIYNTNNFITDNVIYRYFILMHILHFCLYLTFIATNILIFYIFFEIILIPMLLLILSDGYNIRKTKATYYFIFFTIIGSFFLLAGIFALYIKYSTLDFVNILTQQRMYYILETLYPESLIINNFKLKYILSYKEELFIFLCFFIGFCIKIPVFPFHIWLPEAHAEASTVGSVILASLLLKLGTYGLLNFCVPLINYALIDILNILLIFTAIGVLYVSIMLLTQYDIKKMVAYLSIIHMGILVISVLSLNTDAIIGAIFLMITHGLTSAGFFFLIGFYYNRTHTRDLNLINNVLIKTPLFRTYFFWLTLCNVSFPGTASFISEIYVWFGLVRETTFFSFFVLSTTIFAYIISFWLADRFFHKNEFNIKDKNTLKIKTKQIYLDLRMEEIFILIILLFFSIVLGIFPYLLIDVFYNYSFTNYFFITKNIF